MSTRFDRAVVERVFSDAHVIDVDFSVWDKKVVLLAVSDHYEAWSDRRPVLLVEFIKVKNLSCTMPPPELMLDEAEKHMQWNVDDFDLRESKGIVYVRLFGSASTPVLTLECESIKIKSISNQILDKVFPGWNKPFAGMVRRSVEHMINLHQSSM